MSEWPTRNVRDPRALRAIAHPLRLRILNVIGLRGPSTATEIAEEVGESPANCSWHLRQLARYGFIAEAGGGTGRQRPWRLVPEAHRWGEGQEEPELASAGDAAAEVVFDAEYQALRRWQATRRSEPAPWREASYCAQYIGWLTADELRALKEELMPILSRHLDRVVDPQTRPPGSRPVRLVAWAVPDAGSATPDAGSATPDA